MNSALLFNTVALLASNITDNSTIGNCSLPCAASKHGYPIIEWIHASFGDCIYTPKEQASFWIGLSSLGFWIVAQMPQVIENFRRSDASGLSPLFLFIWALGDSTNLVGALLTGQLATQIVTAVYFFLMDILLTGQWIFYTIRNTYLKRRQKQYENHFNVNGESATPPATPNEKRRLLSLLIPCIFVVLACNAMQQQYASVQYNRIGRKLLQETPPIDDDNDGHCNWPPSGWQSILGYSIGCFSAVLYLVSRIPQLLKNFFRGTTEGLSPILFICAFLGNLTYSLSIVLFSVKPLFILSKLPWIVGSAGVLVLDMMMLFQFVYYRFIRKRKTYDEMQDEEEEDAVPQFDVEQQEDEEPAHIKVYYEEKNK